MVSFANLHELNQRRDHDLRSAAGALKAFGTILAKLQYFEVDEATEEQIVIATELKAQRD